MRGFKWALCSLLIFSTSALYAQGASDYHDYNDDDYHGDYEEFQASQFYLELKGVWGNQLTSNRNVFQTQETGTLDVLTDNETSYQIDFTPAGELSNNLGQIQHSLISLTLSNADGLSAGRTLNLSVDEFSISVADRSCEQTTDVDIREIGSQLLSIDFISYCDGDYAAKLRPLKGRLVINKRDHAPTKLRLNDASSWHNYSTSRWYAPARAIDNSIWSYWIGKEQTPRSTPCERFGRVDGDRYQPLCQYSRGRWNFQAHQASGLPGEMLAYLDVLYYDSERIYKGTPDWYNPDYIRTWAKKETRGWQYSGTTLKAGFYKSTSGNSIHARVDLKETVGTGAWIWQYGNKRFPVIQSFDLYHYAHNSRHQNAANRYDVNGNGLAEQDDLLLVMAYLNSGQDSELPANKPMYANFLDVNGDGFVTPLDALHIINHFPSLWYNVRDIYDTNDDGILTVADAHTVINELNQYGSFLPPVRPATRWFVDVSQDGLLTPIDALRVINKLWRLWYNPENRFDVNEDETVSLADADVVQAYIDENGEGPLPEDRPSDQPRIDVNRDGSVTLADKQEIIDEINASWHNSDYLAWDVTDDQFIGEEDAQAVIDYLNANGAGRLSTLKPPNAPFVDTNGDGWITALDALLVINRLPWTPWQNSAIATDVNGDGFTTALDLLILINHSEGPLFNTRLEAIKPDDKPFFDSNGDGMYTPSDILTVLNAL